MYSAKVDRSGVAAAQQNANALAASGLVSSRQQGCESGGAAGLDDDTQRLPDGFLRLEDRFIRNQDDAIYMLSRNGKHQLSDAFWRQGVGSDTSRGAIHRTAGFQGICQRRSRRGVDAN